MSLCKCGCGKEVTPSKYGKREYASRECSLRIKNEKQRKVRHAVRAPRKSVPQEENNMKYDAEKDVSMGEMFSRSIRLVDGTITTVGEARTLQFRDYFQAQMQALRKARPQHYAPIMQQLSGLSEYLADEEERWYALNVIVPYAERAGIVLFAETEGAIS